MRFEKVSFEEYSKARLTMKPDITEEELRTEHDGIILPRRQTKYSAGYDFYIPYDLCINSYNATLFPTGVRWIRDGEEYADPNWPPINLVLMCFPRSSLGFKYGTHLVNTAGIIDQDYCCADNEGHIFLKLYNAGDRPVAVRAGEAVAQGVFLPFGLTVDDAADGARIAGFGSTDG